MILELLFAALVIVARPVLAWRRYRRGAPPASSARYVVETGLLTAILTLLLWRRQVPAQALGLRPDSLMRFAGDTTLCVAVVLGVDAWCVWRITRRLQRARGLEPPRGLAADALAHGRAPASFTAVAIVGAIWEELCFRGVALLLAPPTPAGYAFGVAAGSLAFGAQHLRSGLTGMIYSSGFGVMFSLLYLMTGDLAAVMVAHAAGNIATAVQWAPRIERARLEAERRQAPMFLG